MQSLTGFKMSQTIPMAKKLQDKLISLSEKCVLQSSGAKKSVAWGRKKGAFFLLQATLFSPRSTWQPVRRLTGRLFWASFLYLDASKTNGKKNKQTNKQDKNETRCSSTLPQFFSSSLRAIQIVLPRETYGGPEGSHRQIKNIAPN